MLVVVPISKHRILIFGGEDRQSNNDAIEYDTSKESFTKVRKNDDNELDIHVMGNVSHLIGEERVVALGTARGGHPHMMTYNVATKQITNKKIDTTAV